MIFILLFLGLVLICNIILIYICIISALTCCYAKTYFDKSEENGTRKWPAFCKCFLWYAINKIWELNIEYKNQNAIAKINGACIFACHPHGIIPATPTLIFGLHGDLRKTDILRGKVHMICSTLCFRIPIIRELFLWMGGVKADRDIIEKMLANKNKICIIPGGIKELLLMEYNTLNIYDQHSGFCNIAFDEGVPLIPVYSHGENKVFWFFKPRLLTWFYNITYKKIGYPFPLFVLGPIPIKLTLVVGEPINPASCKNSNGLKIKFYKQLEQLIREKHKNDEISITFSSQKEAMKQV